MENSSKALIIAGSVLVSILLVATGVQVYNSTGKGSADKAKQASEKMWGGVDLGMGLAGGSATVIELPTGWSVAKNKPNGWSKNVTTITDGTNTIPLPKGFELSTKETEDSIEEGLVLTDGTNEFVWIPVENYATYTEDSFGPLTQVTQYVFYHGYDVLDSQENLDYWYGTDYYDYSDFTYETDKANIENNIRKYGGFYVGRYETTIDGTTIGIQQGKTILTGGTLLKEGTNETSEDEYHYRWWGLYKVQKDMYAKNEAVGSLMISSKQWDAIMSFTDYGDVCRPANSYLESSFEHDVFQYGDSMWLAYKSELSGSAYATDSSKYDVSKNIYDLAGNVSEWTLTAKGTDTRDIRGGDYTECWNSADCNYKALGPWAGSDPWGSRVTLYIK